jgi:hypothetical protein
MLDTEYRSVLESAQQFEDSVDGFVKCDRVLRQALERLGLWSDAAHEALCHTGYDEANAGRLYDALRALVRSGLLASRGNIELPAGPRYTECKITMAGEQALQQSNSS